MKGCRKVRLGGFFRTTSLYFVGFLDQKLNVRANCAAPRKTALFSQRRFPR
jgi:hypothetical protein